MTGPLLVVLLAGGEGRRIGGRKPERMLGGRSLLKHAIDRARGYGGTLVLSQRAGLELGNPELPRLLDSPKVAGPLAGLAAAFNTASISGARRILLLPVDMPFLPADLAQRLVAALDAQPEAGAAIACSGGREHPVCSLWRASAAPILETYLQSGQLSLKGLARLVKHVRVEWPGDPFFNINEAGDLAEAERRLAA